MKNVLLSISRTFLCPYMYFNHSIDHDNFQCLTDCATPTNDIKFEMFLSEGKNDFIQGK